MNLTEKKWIDEYKSSFNNLPEDEKPLCLKCNDEKLIACMYHKDQEYQPQHEREDIGCLEFKESTYYN